MKTLEFRVSGQNLRYAEDPGSLIRGSKNYLRAHFRFDGSELAHAKRVCVFSSPTNEEEIPVAIDGKGYCAVPDDVIGDSRFTLYLVCANGQQRIKTNKLSIRQED